MKGNLSGVQLRSYNHTGRSNKMVDAVIFFASANRKVAGKLVSPPERWSTSALLIHHPSDGPPSPLGKAKERGRSTDKQQFETLAE